MKRRKPVMTVEEDDPEEDALIEAEEARLKAAQLEKEIEEQNKFDCLCDGVLNCLSLVDSGFSELLELKDELLQHDLPPSLLVAITLATGKMFRSITDLHTPIQELTRLVNIYSIPWEQRSEALKKLHNDYESKQRQLNIAIRKLQLIDAHTHRLDREKRIMNWEKAFAKITSAKSHGRRWKFMIEAFKKKAKEGINLAELDANLSDEESDEEQDDVENIDNDDGVTEKQRFMLSVIAASPPVEDDGTPQAGSEIESEADGIPSEMSDSTGNVEDTSPDIKQRRHGVSFVSEEVQEEREEKIKIIKEEKPPSEEKAVWTDEPEYETHLAIRVFRPLQLKDDDGGEVSCTLSFAKENYKTATLPLAHTTQQPSDEQTPPADELEMGEAKAPEKKGKGRRKSIGFASRPSSPPALSSPSKSMLKSKPSSILKKAKPNGERPVTPEPEKIDRSKYEEVVFEITEEAKDAVRIALHRGEQSKMVAMVTVTWDELQEKQFAIKYHDGSLSDENKEQSLDEQLSSQEIIYLPLQGIKLGVGGHSPGVIGQLPLLCYWMKKEKAKKVSVEVNTDGVRELIKEITGIDMNMVTKDELMYILGREFHDVSTSAMSFTSSSSHKSGFIPMEELEVIREQHDLELKGIQDDYDAKVQELLAEIEKLQSVQPQQVLLPRGPAGDVRFADVEQLPKHARLPDIPRPPDEGRPPSVGHWRAPKIPQLPDWGAHLPKNVWERMRMLTEEMIAKRKQLDMRIRHQIAANIEKKLASQYKLQRNESTIQGPLQDVSLPALFMPSRSGNVYNPRAKLYFHPTGTAGDLRLTQPPSIFQLPPLPEKARVSVVNLFELSKNFEQPVGSEWLNRIASAPSRGSRATTAGSRVTPHTPAPTANIQPSDVYS
ncbi:unnamed protein product [Clavelina lepadiformis]|uniref:Uncharacterized protein n=1 Tax=Clavelina lepadiformis TaxID=159417 RepID=A0ABP0FZB6_CLALP